MKEDKTKDPIYQKGNSKRSKTIIKTGVVGIATNVTLVVFKIVVGLLSNSIAIILDALNNLSDVLSSIITIVGMKLALKPADKEHPMGHGRVEYLSATLISAIIITAGIIAIVESIKKIITPLETHYTLITFVVVGIAIITKIVLGRYTKNIGDKVNSSSLVASGTDALFDAVVSTATLVGAGITLLWGINIDGWIGAIISIVMVKAGLDILTGTINSILGDRIDPEFSHKIKNMVRTLDHVLDCADLVVNRYGPETMIGSIDIEVSDKLSPRDIYHTTLMVKEKLQNEFGILATVGIYVKNTKPGPELNFEKEITDLMLAQKHVLGIHGFYTDLKRKKVTMDIIKDFEVINTKTFKDNLVAILEQQNPDFDYFIWLDTDFSD